MVILVGSIVAVWCLMHFGYTITEERHQEIVDALEERHKKDFAEAELKVATEGAPVEAISEDKKE